MANKKLLDSQIAYDRFHFPEGDNQSFYGASMEAMGNQALDNFTGYMDDAPEEPDSNGDTAFFRRAYYKCIEGQLKAFNDKLDIFEAKLKDFEKRLDIHSARCTEEQKQQVQEAVKDLTYETAREIDSLRKMCAFHGRELAQLSQRER
jgi:hypothetical protein